MSTKSKEYIDLEAELLKETNNRIVEDNKLILDITNETLIRRTNESNLLNEINKYKTVSSNNLKKIQSEIKLVKDDIAILKEPKKSIKTDINNIISTNIEKVNQKKELINETKKQIKENIIEIESKVIEKSKILITDANKSKINELNYELNKLSVTNNSLNDKINTLNIDINTINKTTKELEKVKLLEDLIDENLLLENSFTNFDKILNIFYKINSENLLVIKTTNEIINKLNNIEKSNIFSEKISLLSEKVKFYQDKVDLDYLILQKLVLEKTRYLKNFKTLESNNFSDIEEIKKYEIILKNNYKSMEQNIEKVDKQIRESEIDYNNLKILCSDINNLYNNIIIDNKHKIYLKNELENLREELENNEIKKLKEEIEKLKQKNKNSAQAEANAKKEAEANARKEAEANARKEADNEKHKHEEHKHEEHKHEEHKEEKASIEIVRLDVNDNKVTIEVKMINGNHWHYQIDDNQDKEVINGNSVVVETTYGKHTITVFLADSEHKHISSDKQVVNVKKLEHEEHKEHEEHNNEHHEHNLVRRLPILKIKKNINENSNKSGLDYSEKTDILDDSIIMEYINKELKNIDNLNILDYIIKINTILVEDSNLEGDKINKNIMGKVANIKFRYNNIDLIGQGIKSQLIFRNKLEDKNFSFQSIEKTNDMVEIISEEDALKLANLKYNRGYKKKLNVKLCYYCSSNSEYIVPAYTVEGNNNDIQLLSTIIPAHINHIPKIQLSSVSIKSNTLEKEIKKLGMNDKDSDIKINKDENVEYNKFTIVLHDLNYDFDINLITTHNIINNINKDKSFSILIPKELEQNSINKLDRLNFILSTTNNLGFTTTLPLVINLLKYKSLFKLIELRRPNPNHGGNIHNYGIEWAESVLAGTVYSRFITEMNSHGVHKEYSLDYEDSKEKHFKDFNNGGLDDYYVDDVDTSAYIGHGYGGGFTFETSVDDSVLTSEDAAGGKAWGNRDLEFQALMSCQVLKETYSGKSWAQRWGPCFNGLHLLCGFQTNAWVIEHNMLKNFAENQYKNKQTVMMSWINAANDDQPEGTQPVIMGPLIENSNTTNYNSVNSSIDGLYRAHWNDHAWGISSGPGFDVNKANIKGWWRVVFTI